MDGYIVSGGIITAIAITLAVGTIIRSPEGRRRRMLLFALGWMFIGCTVSLSVGLLLQRNPEAVVWAQTKNSDTARPTNVQTLPATALSRTQKNNSGPLVWVGSDTNPKTVFWIQGRFVPVNDAAFQGDAEVVTILCSFREYECLEIDSTSPFVRGEQVFIQDFKPVSWDNTGILATSRSLDNCTDETLKIRFSPPSVILINSPVLPMSESCRKINAAWDKFVGKKGSMMAGQMEQDVLVPTRGTVPFEDVSPDTGNPPTPVRQKNH